MNFTINVNQYAAITEFGDKLDLEDLSVFDSIRNFYPKAITLSDDLGVWIWISHVKIIEDLPLLKFKSKQSVINRINNLIDCKILERHPDSKKLGRSYYKAGENYSKLINYTPSQKYLVDPPKNICDPPPKNIWDDHNTNIDPSTIDPKIIDEFYFDCYWELYHSITKLDKTDKKAAYKHWVKLTIPEKFLATDKNNISNYYNSLNDKKYCKKARSYLEGKNFNDEYKVKKEVVKVPQKPKFNGY